MSIRPNSLGNDDHVPVQQTLTGRKRSESITDASSAKRRRISLASIDLTRELQENPCSYNELGQGTSADRFIPSRPKQFLPLNITPRTNRIARSFGLVDSRLLRFTDDHDNLSTTAGEEPQMRTLLRRCASTLLHIPKPLHPTSVIQNLANRKQCLLALDGPGMPYDPFTYPISWSKNNLLAVACGNDVYYQDLDIRSVVHFGRLEVPMCGRLHAIEWADNKGGLAVGSTTGVVQVWDADFSMGRRAVRDISAGDELGGVGAMCWTANILTVGRNDGSIFLFDVRAGAQTTTLKRFKCNGKVMGVKWNTDGHYMASGDHRGKVFIWDSRAGKWLGDGSKKGSQMRHRGPVKALAWCPWKPDLLATGSTYPEGKIHIWSSSSPLSSTSRPKPLHTMSLNTSVLSLQWSPHCKELLSTHGSSFEPLPAPCVGTRTPTMAELRPIFKPVPSPLTYSIAVHAYPSCKRLLSLTNAHMGPVGHSCLGPDGTKVFTVCHQEQAMKMWQVWAKREDLERKESVFDMCAIR